MKDLESRLVVIGFKAPADLVERADIAARAEGLSRSDVARRALMRDLEARTRPETTEAA